MKWRRPDISFNFKDRKVVIELQNNNVDLDTIVDKDIFYRINNVQVIWVFGNGNESKYDYMKLFNYKNTLLPIIGMCLYLTKKPWKSLFPEMNSC